MDEYKRCPDCAEMVRAQARRCRYCGYRFEGVQVPTLLDLLRRQPPTARLEDVLAGWGTDLAQGEDVRFFGFCRLDRDDGYLLVTNARVLFYSSRGARALLELPLDVVSHVETAWRRAIRELRIVGPNGAVSFSRFASRRALEDVAGRLRQGIGLADGLSPPTG